MSSRAKLSARRPALLCAFSASNALTQSSVDPLPPARCDAARPVSSSRPHPSPSRCDIAEIGIKEIVRAHRCKACVDGAQLAALDLVHGRSHVVVGATSGNTSDCREASCVCVKEHLMPFTRIGIGEQKK